MTEILIFIGFLLIVIISFLFKTNWFLKRNMLYKDQMLKSELIKIEIRKKMIYEKWNLEKEFQNNFKINMNIINHEIMEIQNKILKILFRD